MMSGRKSQKTLFLVKFASSALLMSLVSSSFLSGLWPKTTRFCFNSMEPQRLNSQCVYCSYFTFNTLTLGCTGTSALNVNITTDQAFCIISSCISQVKQTPIWLGRKKRDVEVEQSALELLDEDEGPKAEERASVVPVKETIELGFNGEMHKFLVENEVRVDVEL